MRNEFELTVRCNSCSAETEIYADYVPAEFEQYGKPHIEVPGSFSCCECGRWHKAGIGVLGENFDTVKALVNVGHEGG